MTAVVAVAFAAWALVLASGDDGSEAIVRQISGGTIEGRLTYVADDSTASLTLGGLEPLGAERSYQLWVVHDGEASSVGIFNAASDGTAGATFQAELEQGDVVAVTIEPFGGSPAPTSDPILSTEI